LPLTLISEHNGTKQLKITGSGINCGLACLSVLRVGSEYHHDSFLQHHRRQH
jgi:hypothetical protein